MNASIYEGSLLIGHAALIPGDVSMGHVYGNFIPTGNYYKKIQRTAWDFNAGLPGGDRWYSFEFNAQLDNGYFLSPVGGYTIHDMHELLPGETPRIDIAGIDSNVINDFIITVPPRPFVEEPWREIDITEKLFLETELHREISKQHVLANSTCSALCRSISNDNVLFETHDKGFALVHLTYQTETESHWPATSFFESFDEFKFKKMYPDKNEWEW